MWISSFAIIVLGFFLYGLGHSWLASIRFKNWLFAWMPGMERYYRLIYSIFATITLMPLGYLLLSLPDRLLYKIPAPILYFTLLVQLGVVFLLFVGVRQTDNFGFLGISQALKGKEDTEPLIVTGLYRSVRHPIYSLGLVLMWLFPVMTSNLLAFFFSITVYILIGSIFEERKLVLKYPEYRAYQQQVPMFIPKIR